MRRVLQFVKGYFPFIVIGCTFLWSMVAIAMYRAAETEPDTILLRIGHWQLEASVREALNRMASDYSAYRRDRGLPAVKIVQDAIPEMIYAQWLTTQLMGGTAPDMIEVGLGGLPYHLWVQYYNRYFIALTPYVNRPNEHNAGTALEGVPLRSTFKDGMRNSYIEEMQTYVSIPLSQFGIRIFYNRDLLRKLTGAAEPPSEYRAFLAACEKIRAHKDERGQPYVPIAGSRYHLWMWISPMVDPLTYSVKDVADFNRDGFVDNAEQFAAFMTGRLSFSHPAIVAHYRMFRELTDHFQAGYTGLARDEAVFLFAQQRSVFMTTGTWDARSLLEQAEGTFEVGVMDYPIPAADDPYYGDLIRGPNYERIAGGFPFAITRSCKHPEIALDFLLYMASQGKNEELNEIIGWIPSVRGADIPSFLEGFEPHLDGVYGCFNPASLGGETWLRWTQQFANYQVRQIDYEELVADFEPYYKERGLTDFLEQQKDWRRGLNKNEQFLAGVRAEALFGERERAESKWIRYRALTSDRQVSPEIYHARQMKLVMRELELPPAGPYEYSPEVLARVRERLKE
ncbi:MAG: carbohydrate ABC transporter substrate-binding protein [Lentisphaerae bacterium]|nr:carbohydrate ABC transporter substrate-binding protein [Lentisphaerota bacterium]